MSGWTGGFSRALVLLMAVVVASGCGPRTVAEPTSHALATAEPSPVQPVVQPAAESAARTGGRIVWLDAKDRYSTRAPTKWGVHLLLDDGVTQWPTEVWDQHVTHARRLIGAGGYVLELVRLDDLNVPKWQAYLDLIVANGLTPMLRLATYQDRQRGHWVAPPTDIDGRRGYRDVAARYAAFIRELQAPGPLYVIVGNEPNRGDEWGGEPDPVAYARFLSDLSEALRGDPRVLVLNGAMDQYAPNTQGLALNGFMAIDGASFLERMNAAMPDVWNSIDIWASHAYPARPFESPPSLSEYRVDDVYREGSNRIPPAPGITNRGINSYRSELLLLRQFGVSHIEKVIVTETGWRHRDSQTPSIDTAGATIPARQAAEYIVAGFIGDRAWSALAPSSWTPWAWDPDVQAVILFALAGHPMRWGHTNMLDVDQSGRVLQVKPGFKLMLK